MSKIAAPNTGPGWLVTNPLAIMPASRSIPPPARKTTSGASSLYVSALHPSGKREIPFSAKALKIWSERALSTRAIRDADLKRNFIFSTLLHYAATRVIAKPIELSCSTRSGNIIRYTPDFLVEVSESSIKGEKRKILVDVTLKSEQQYQIYPTNQMIEEWAKENGFSYFSLNEDFFNSQRVANVISLIPYSGARNYEKSYIFKAIYAEFLRFGAIRFGKVTGAAGMNLEMRAQIKAMMMTMIANGILWTDMNDPINQRTMVYLNRPESEHVYPLT